MKHIDLSQDIVPVSEFRSQVSRWLNHIKDTGHPVVLTQNGKSVGVLLSAHDYDALQYRERFFHSIEKGLKDAEEGLTYTTEEIKEKLEKALKK
ncbi:MAG: prevent-host-death protein [Caedibacter sp. 37-49]|nr:MAG: prevent-host-death protein [Caedibacter sp. 37-49]